jgi:DNA-binding transcriptional ArsR family regulator
MNEKVVALVRAVADPAVLRMMAELSGDPVSVAELAVRLGLAPDVAGLHLRVIGAVGILATERVGRDRLYRIDPDRMQALADSVSDDVDQPVGRVPPGDIAQFFRGERLERMPAQRAKQISVLAYLIDDFELERDYPEADVNAVIGRRNADFATIRRGFVDEGLMTRTANVYRRTSASVAE